MCGANPKGDLVDPRTLKKSGNIWGKVVKRPYCCLVWDLDVYKFCSMKCLFGRNWQWLRCLKSLDISLWKLSTDLVIATCPLSARLTKRLANFFAFHAHKSCTPEPHDVQILDSPSCARTLAPKLKFTY